ncbi:MAG: aminoacyl-tRNA hydrolase, partial [Cyclobacteriaceae bacterium]|nr:aminoacyl-tRNA hydrolase [Cyclobacteriaceae bacterium]
TFHLIKPTTYMNLSGKAVKYWLNELSIPKEKLLVVVDEIALPFGSLRMRPKGSAAGHNGLKNIEAELEGQDYARLRFGVGDDFPKGRQADYVLSNFTPKQQEELPSYIEKAKNMIVSFGTQGISRTMTEYND